MPATNDSRRPPSVTSIFPERTKKTRTEFVEGRRAEAAWSVVNSAPEMTRSSISTSPNVRAWPRTVKLR
ncbi:hypothetical protein C5B96_12710 [Subtercola sp. Z020]|nr:hypothetical protein C5B96_12710 [Subtercola sp. Z020]